MQASRVPKDDRETSGRQSTALTVRDLPRSFQAVGWIGLAVFVVLYVTTVQAAAGDTSVYRAQIFRYAQTGGSKPALLWDFGHLFWRPLAYSLWQVTRPLTAHWARANPALEINAVLYGLNFVSGGALALLACVIGRNLGLRSPPALMVSTGLLLCSAVLNYMHSGTAYLPGLALHLSGIWFLLKATQDRRHRLLLAIFGGTALALAIDFWFVYILSLPAALAAAAIIPVPGCSDGISQRARERTGLLITTAAVIVAVAFVTFLIGAMICHISTVPQLRDWIITSGHSTTADRRLLRFPAGLTRTFLYLGGEGRALKRFTFGDPYEPVQWPQLLIGAGLWKVLLVLAFGCAFLWSLTRTRDGRAALIVALAGIIPTIWFALFLFETGQEERYLPFYPALLIAICVLLRQRLRQRITQRAAAVFLGVLALVNLKAFAFDLRDTGNRSAERLRLVQEHTAHGGVVLVLSYDDPVLAFPGQHPFSQSNEADGIPSYLVMELRPGAPWNAGSSCRILAAWQAGGEAWLSKRLIASRPQPDWRWVEGDHPALTWTKLSGFFNELDKDSDVGGPDGFVRIQSDGRNRLLLRETCGQEERLPPER